MRVLLICYAIEADKGSEEGSGFNFALSLAAQPDTELTLLTRPNNAARLKQDARFAEIEVESHDPPRWLTFWKRKGRGIIAFYYLWQLTLRGRVRKLATRAPFDVIHQYNFHTDWAPHHLYGLGSPVVWGPICHQPPLPRDYFADLPRRELWKDRLRTVAKNFFWHLDPHLSRAARRTDLVLYANSDLAPPFRGRPNVVQQTFGGAAFVRPPDDHRTPMSHDRVSFLHVGRMAPIKGAHVALDAFIEFRNRGGDGSLVLIGSGPLADLLHRKATASRFEQDISIRTWMTQADLAQAYAKADVFLYPSLGNQDTVVAEALASGLPILCLEGSGSHAMADSAAVSVSRTDVRGNLASAMLRMERLQRHDPNVWAAMRSSSLERSRIVSWPGTADSVRRRYSEVGTT